MNKAAQFVASRIKCPTVFKNRVEKRDHLHNIKKRDKTDCGTISLLSIAGKILSSVLQHRL